MFSTRMRAPCSRMIRGSAHTICCPMLMRHSYGFPCVVPIVGAWTAIAANGFTPSMPTPLSNVAPMTPATNAPCSSCRSGRALER